MTNATTTANTILKSSSTKTGPFTKLLDIKSFPDMGSEPDKIDTTDLSATRYKTEILGLQETPDLTFEANYDLVTYEKLVGLGGTVQWFNLEFGEGGEHGIFEWSGEIEVYATGGGVDEVREMTVVLSAETEIKLKKN